MEMHSPLITGACQGYNAGANLDHEDPEMLFPRPKVRLSFPDEERKKLFAIAVLK